MKIKLTDNLRLLLIGAGLLLIIGGALLFHNDSGVRSSCGPYRDDKTVTIDGQKIHAEVAQSLTEKEKGLGGRPCIEKNQAMLFTYEKSGQYAFWMKDMKFPIDIVWISMEKKAVAIERNVQPNTYPGSKFVNDSHHLAQYVIELKANRSNELHMTLGTPVNF